MTQQQSIRAGEQPETPSTAGTEDLGAAPERKGSGTQPKGQTQHDQDNPKRVQYGQGFSKDHPAQPGTDTHLAHSASQADKGKSSQKRSG